MSKDLIPSEPRSFLRGEEPYEEVVQVKGDIITSARPTNRQLGDGINHLNREFETDKTTRTQQLKTIREDIRMLKNAIAPEDGRKPSGLSSYRAAFLRTFAAGLASLSGFVVLWKILAGIAPSFADFFSVVNRVITHLGT
jgi:hypothetical protein